jgi:hypothetical protein
MFEALTKDSLVTRRPAPSALLEGVRALVPADQLSAIEPWSGHGGFTGDARWTTGFPALSRLAGVTVRRKSPFSHVSNY